MPTLAVGMIGRRTCLLSRCARLASMAPPKPLSAMRDLDPLFQALSRSKFRSRFRLGPKEHAYLAQKTLPVILEHGQQFVHERLVPAEPQNDGRQTPMRGHPIFIAQHATATCCRGCLEKWHHIPRGQPLVEEEIEYILGVLARWLTENRQPTPPALGIPCKRGRPRMR